MSDLCRREGIKPHSYYSWTKEFMEAGGSFAGGHLHVNDQELGTGRSRNNQDL